MLLSVITSISSIDKITWLGGAAVERSALDQQVAGGPRRSTADLQVAAVGKLSTFIALTEDD
jgi:hypothetical protein